MMTIRSNDQFNTTIYGYDDRFRGIKGTRMVVLLNRDDMTRLGFKEGDQLSLSTQWNDGIAPQHVRLPRHRLRHPDRLLRHLLPGGQCADAAIPLRPGKFHSGGEINSGDRQKTLNVVRPRVNYCIISPARTTWISPNWETPSQR